eukprot:TRINITY_DN25033_c0_g1_i1.p1 TRINITY_DN25033_c0_g1~~TRINITY_DN25033_c0_g1_i1.p1  ORF type:complete len:373 (+),score=83.94 TRINITY_DN25033_c0_g1_i1:133-1251(+)
MLTTVDVSKTDQLRDLISILQKQSEANKKVLMEASELKESLDKSRLSSSSAVDANQKAQLQTPSTIQHLRQLTGGSEEEQKLPHDSTGKKKLPRGRLFIEVERLEKEFRGRDEMTQSVRSDYERGWKSGGEENSMALLDVSQMRLFLGSEQALREQSARTFSHSVSTPSRGGDVMFEVANLSSHEREDTWPDYDKAGSSIFENEPFKEFTTRKVREMASKDNLHSLLKMREKALEIRHQTQVEYMKQMLENKRVSPRTFQIRQHELEKWVTKEREDIRNTRREYEKSLFRFADAVKRTQRDITFMRKVMSKKDLRASHDLNLHLRDWSFKQSSVSDDEAFTSSGKKATFHSCLLYTSTSPRDRQKSRMPSSA